MTGTRADAPTDARAAAARAPRRRDRSLARGDRVALGLGVALAVLMLAWFAWQLTRTVLRDRAVAPGMAPAPAAHGH